MPLLHVPTLSFALAVLFAFVFATKASSWRAFRVVPGFSVWLAADAMIAASYALGVFRGPDPGPLFLLPFNLLSTGALELMYRGFRRFLGQPPPRAAHALAVAAAWAVFGGFAAVRFGPFGVPAINYRVIIISCMTVVYAVLAGVTARRAEASVRFTVRPMVFALTLLGALALVRAVATIVHPLPVWQTNATLGQMWFLFTSSLVGMLWSVGALSAAGRHVDRVRMRAIEADRMREEQLFYLLAESPVPTAIVQRDGRFEHVNRRFAEVFADGCAQGLERFWALTLADPAERERARRWWREAEQGTAGNALELVLARREGGTGVFEVHARRIGAGVVATLVDITALRQQAEALEAARAAAESAARARGQFLANMSHEIRTPMNAILGFAELGRAGAERAGERESFDEIHTAASGLLQILNDVLDFSKLEAGRVAIASEGFAPRDVMARVEALVRGTAQAHGLALELTVDDAVPARVVGDGPRLSQVLTNVVGNAVKFTERGRVGARLELRAGEGARGVLVGVVEDTGPGVSADELARLFVPFTQVEGASTRRHGGTGLGLVIARDLVRAMGGELTMTSTPGVGTVVTFTVSVGLVARAESEPLPSAATASDATPASLRGKRVLVVEDNPINQKVVAAMLQRAGVVVRLANDGVAALDALRADAGVDLVLMDLQMPGMDGLETTRRVRAELSVVALPIVALTAHALSEERERCLAAGMNDYLSKPVAAAALYATLERWTAAKSAA